MGPAPRYGHAMAYDKARGRVVFFGGSGAPPDTATAANLFSDTWELPVAAHGPGPPALVSFTITPEIVRQAETFTLRVGLDQPAPVDVAVSILFDGTAVRTMVVEAGQTTSELALPSAALDFGTNSFTAVWGDVSLHAPVTFQ